MAGFKISGALALLVFVSVVPGMGAAGTAQAASGACPAPAADYGRDALSINLPPAATYRVWSHMMVPSAAASTFMLQIDSNQCYNMGGGTLITPNTWTWVDYADGNAAAPVDITNLAAGTHSLTLIGAAPGVTVDDILFATDTTCVPTGNGSNCSASATASPTSSATAGTTSGGGGKSDTVVASAAKKLSVNWPLAVGALILVAGGGAWLWRRHRLQYTPQQPSVMK